MFLCFGNLPKSRAQTQLPAESGYSASNDLGQSSSAGAPAGYETNTRCDRGGPNVGRFKRCVFVSVPVLIACVLLVFLLCYLRPSSQRRFNQIGRISIDPARHQTNFRGSSLLEPRLRNRMSRTTELMLLDNRVRKHGYKRGFSQYRYRSERRKVHRVKNPFSLPVTDLALHQALTLVETRVIQSRTSSLPEEHQQVMSMIHLPSRNITSQQLANALPYASPRQLYRFVQYYSLPVTFWGLGTPAIRPRRSPSLFGGFSYEALPSALMATQATRLAAVQRKPSPFPASFVTTWGTVYQVFVPRRPCDRISPHPLAIATPHFVCGPGPTNAEYEKKDALTPFHVPFNYNKPKSRYEHRPGHIAVTPHDLVAALIHHEKLLSESATATFSSRNNSPRGNNLRTEVLLRSTVVRDQRILPLLKKRSYPYSYRDGKRLPHVTSPAATARHRLMAHEHPYYSPFNLEPTMSDDTASMFVSIAQFMDVLCSATLEELYFNARNKRRVFVGVVDQRHSSEPPCLRSTFVNRRCFARLVDADKITDDERTRRRTSDVPLSSIGSSSNFSARTYAPESLLGPESVAASHRVGSGSLVDEFCYADNVRVRRIDPEEGRGPTFGRFVAQLLYQGESYFLSIDSHMRFIPHWDALMITNLRELPAGVSRAVLSQYPSTFERYSQLISHRRERASMTMCAAHYNKQGIIRLDSVLRNYNGFPLEQPFAAGGFVFGDAQFAHEVPFDPFLYFIFDGEESLYAARLWTSGYNMYRPNGDLLFHTYGRHGAPRFWSLKAVKWGAPQTLGNARVKFLLELWNANLTSTTPRHKLLQISPKRAKREQLSRGLPRLGMGHRRSLDKYYAYAGVDRQSWIVRKNFCSVSGGNESHPAVRPPKYHRSRRSDAKKKK